MSRIINRFRTIASLLRHFASRGAWFLIPFVLILLLAGVLLILTGGLSYVAPFLYGIF